MKVTAFDIEEMIKHRMYDTVAKTMLRITKRQNSIAACKANVGHYIAVIKTKNKKQKTDVELVDTLEKVMKNLKMMG